MAYAEMCKHGSGAPQDVLEALPDYQGKTGRHKCVVCAIRQGLRKVYVVRVYVVRKKKIPDKSRKARLPINSISYERALTIAANDLYFGHRGAIRVYRG